MNFYHLMHFFPFRRIPEKGLTEIKYRKEEKRKKKKEAQKKKQEEKKKVKDNEIKRLKNVKKDEIIKKLKEITSITGNDGKKISKNFPIILNILI